MYTPESQAIVCYCNLSCVRIDKKRTLILKTYPDSEIQLLRTDPPHTVCGAIPVKEGDVIFKKDRQVINTIETVTRRIEEENLDTLKLALKKLPLWAVSMKQTLSAIIEEKETQKMREGPQLEI
jgi:hypothetical protein